MKLLVVGLLAFRPHFYIKGPVFYYWCSHMWYQIDETDCSLSVCLFCTKRRYRVLFYSNYGWRVESSGIRPKNIKEIGEVAYSNWLESLLVAVSTPVFFQWLSSSAAEVDIPMCHRKSIGKYLTRTSQLLELKAGTKHTIISAGYSVFVLVVTDRGPTCTSGSFVRWKPWRCKQATYPPSS